MNIEKKKEVIKKLSNRVLSSKCFYIVNSCGLTVNEINYFRKECFNYNLYYSVVKNTFIKKLFNKFFSDDNLRLNFFNKVLKGFSAILISKDVNNIPAKLIKDFRKKKQTNLPILKGALIEGELLFNLNELINIKSKEESISDLFFYLNSPLHNIIILLQSGQNKLLMILDFLSKK